MFGVLFLGLFGAATGIHSTFGDLDGQKFIYYGSNTSEVILMTEWTTKVNAVWPNYWIREKDRMWGDHEDLQHRLDQISNHTNGHTLQRMYGCELYDDGTTRGYDQYSYDEEDFISLDLKTGTWTGDQAKITKWDPNGRYAPNRKYYLENGCIMQLQLFVNYSSDTVGKKGNYTLQYFTTITPGINFTAGDLNEEHNVTEVIPTTAPRTKSDVHETECKEPVGRSNGITNGVPLDYVTTGAILVAVLVPAVCATIGFITWHLKKKKKNFAEREEKSRKESDIPLKVLTCDPAKPTTEASPLTDSSQDV